MHDLEYYKSEGDPTDWWKLIPDVDTRQHPVCVGYYLPLTKIHTLSLFLHDPFWYKPLHPRSHMLHFSLNGLQGNDWMETHARPDIQFVVPQTPLMKSYAIAFHQGYTGIRPGWEVSYYKNLERIQAEYTCRALATGDWLLLMYLASAAQLISIRYHPTQEACFAAKYAASFEDTPLEYQVLNIYY